ncbi:MAG: hypothetical protein R2747_18055 [Pyrinomonadaceae bacterium]
MIQQVFEIGGNLEQKHFITLSNNGNSILIKVEKLDLQECDDCAKKAMIQAEDKRFMISWCTYCADKVVLGKFDDKKEFLSLDVMEIQNWTDSGSSQIIETPQKSVVVKILSKLCMR